MVEQNISGEDILTINRVAEQKNFIEDLFKNFSLKDAERVKEIEKATNHDVKAIEYFLKERFDKNKELSTLKEYLHFSCTSEDINNLAYALMIDHSM